MDLTKVYFKADTQAKRDFIKAVFGMNYYVSEHLADQDILYYAECNGLWKLHGCNSIIDDIKTRTEADPLDFCKFALKGFKEPWEVVEEGRKFVTTEDRAKFTRNDCLGSLRGVRMEEGEGWVDIFGYDVWNDLYTYSVPADYVFEKPVEEMTVEQICKELGREIKITK